MLGLGAAVGFLSRHVRGRRRLSAHAAPDVLGDSSAIAVATGADQIVASSVSGALGRWRRGNIDLPHGLVLTVRRYRRRHCRRVLVGLLHRLGHADVFISLVYVIFLGLIGSLMSREHSRRVTGTTRASPPRCASRATPGSTACRCEMRFQRSRLYISAIPPLMLGAIVGLARRGCSAPVAASLSLRLWSTRCMPTPCRDRHVAVQDHFRHRRRHHPSLR